MFTLITVWINGCVNNREAGDLRRYCAHYGVTVMYTACCWCPGINSNPGAVHPMFYSLFPLPITKLYWQCRKSQYTVYPKKYAHGFVVLCFVVVMQSFIMNSHEVFIHFHQGCFAGTGAIVRLPQCQWSKPDGYGKISQCITTTKHSKAKTVCIFLGIYCNPAIKSYTFNRMHILTSPTVISIMFQSHVLTWYYFQN